MSEKRFKGYAEKTGRHHELIIIDSLGEEYSITDDFFKSKDVIFDMVDLLNVMNDTLLERAKENHKLNEQQSTINKLQEEKEYWESKAMTLLMQVRRLTSRMTDKEVEEFKKELEE